MLIIPLVAQPSQTVSATLARQQCTITLRTRTNGQGITATNLFCDLFLDGNLLLGGVICQNYNLIVRNYLSFVGDFAFWDMLGSDDPVWTGLGTRFLLTYYEPQDFPTA